jgi:hypothetical protein
VLVLTVILGVLGIFGAAFGADVVPPVIDLPGTQPQEVGNLESPDRCDNCHGGYDSATYSNEPAFGWRGSAMGNAGRDPIFWATLAVAEQDFDGAGDLCIRCHSAGGWVAGRSTPTDGSGLQAADDDGIDCDTCHLATNPDDLEHQGVMFEPFVASEFNTGEGFYGSGMLSIWGGNEKLGPYTADDAQARHQRMKSRFHRGTITDPVDGEITKGDNICGTCHDVSNSAVGHFAPNHGAQPLAVGLVNTSGERVHPDQDHLVGGQQAYVALNNPPYAYGIVERTYSEWKASALDTMNVMNFPNLPTDLQAQSGALNMAYQSAMLAGGTYVDGTKRTFTCMGCHMRADIGEGCNKNGTPTRADLPKHDLTGGNYWVWPLIKYQDQQGTLRLGGGLNEIQLAAMDAGQIRGEDQLRMAASLNVTETASDIKVKITNLTGHKLITGYPEGRRMWVNIKWYDAGNNLVGEEGAYGDLSCDPAHCINPVDSQPFVPQSILDPANTKIYEVHPAMTQGWAQTLMAVAPAVYGPIVIGYDRETGADTGTIADLAAGTLGPYVETFHFVLNNYVASDNRIPPYGMDYDTALVRNALPVPADQYGNPGSGGVYEYWDEVSYTKPSGATYAEITLYYQGTSWEYVQFLWKGNNEQNAFLGQEGVNMLDAWINADPAAPMVPPFAMATAAWGEPPTCTPTEPTEVTCDDGIDNDCDTLIDAADPDCPTCTITEDPEVTCDDGLDNDCDGFIDAADPDCPTCTITEDPEVTCDDGLDNDCDGFIDGNDPDCQVDCSVYGTRQLCNNQPTCRWDNKNKVCIPN